MKILKSSLLALALLSTQAIAGEQVSVTVKGMVCSFCSQGITKKFKAEKAVSDINVDLDKHLVSISLKDNEKMEDSKIEKILTDSGYGVEKIERK